jgi:DNA-binding transcriptional LysR family regulator
VTQVAMIDPDLENLARAEVPVVLAYPGEWKLRPREKNLKIASSKVASLISSIYKGDQNVHWVMPSARFKLRVQTDQFFGVNQLKGRIVFESDVIASLVRSVVDGIGIAFLPLLYIAREMREKSIRVVGPKEGYWKYRVWLACHNQNKNDVLIKSLSHSFKEICDQSLG